MNPPAPMMGGMNMPAMEAAGSMPPATWGLKPAFFIMGMVNVPVETVLAMALPEIEPKSALARTETLAGPTGPVTHRGQGEIDEEPLRARFFQERPEEHEKEHVGGQHVGHDAEDPVALVEHRGAQPHKGVAGMGKEFRHVRPRRSRRPSAGSR